MPAGIAALVAGFAFGFALPFGRAPASVGSQMSDGSRVRVASLGTDVTFVSARGETETRSESPVPLWRRLSFDQRFAFDQAPEFLRPALCGRGGLDRRRSSHHHGD